jgi:hypothetical protein
MPSVIQSVKLCCEKGSAQIFLHIEAQDGQCH